MMNLADILKMSMAGGDFAQYDYFPQQNLVGQTYQELMKTQQADDYWYVE